MRLTFHRNGYGGTLGAIFDGVVQEIGDHAHKQDIFTRDDGRIEVRFQAYARILGDWRVKTDGLLSDGRQFDWRKTQVRASFNLGDIEKRVERRTISDAAANPGGE